jgi:hypothetical protein
LTPIRPTPAGWFSVQPGDIILELDDMLSMVDFHRIADGRQLTLDEVQALTGGHVTVIPDDAAPLHDHELMFRKNGRGNPGTLVARYLRKEDETDMALLKRRAQGEMVPAIPADAVLPVTLERRREDVKPAPGVRGG